MLSRCCVAATSSDSSVTTFYIGLEINRALFQGTTLDLSQSLRYFKDSLLYDYMRFNPGEPPAGMGVADRMLTWHMLPDEVCTLTAGIDMPLASPAYDS